MSHEFYQIMVGSPTMSLYSWKQLARWSIDYSCLEDKVEETEKAKDPKKLSEKADCHRILNDEWKKFCNYVVTTYGDLMVDGEIDEARFRAKCSEGACEIPK
jgi:adenosine deaminase CECR1